MSQWHIQLTDTEVIVRGVVPILLFALIALGGSFAIAFAIDWLIDRLIDLNS